MHVFTYGTLMFPQVWQAVVGREFSTVEGTLERFAVYRVCGAVYPGMTAASESDIVRGVVYLDVDNESLKRLDVFEGDFYDRRTIQVTCADGETRSAIAYIVPDESRDGLTDEPWDGDTFISSGGIEKFFSRYQGFAWLADKH